MRCRFGLATLSAVVVVLLAAPGTGLAAGPPSQGDRSDEGHRLPPDTFTPKPFADPAPPYRGLQDYLPYSQTMRPAELESWTRS